MKWENIRKKQKYFLLLAYLVCYLISYIFKIGCIWKHFLGIPCPGCGLTRGVLEMLKGDFRTALAYNPMCWSVGIILIYFLFEGEVFSNKFINRLVIISVLAGLLIVWIYRLYTKDFQILG